MGLSLGFDSPSDLLGKIERDLTRFETAEAEQNRQRIADALYDFSVAVTSVKDWVKARSSTAYTAADVEDLVSKSVALSSFRDIANSR